MLSLPLSPLLCGCCQTSEVQVLHDCGLGLQESKKNVVGQGINHPAFSLSRAFIGLIF